MNMNASFTLSTLQGVLSDFAVADQDTACRMVEAMEPSDRFAVLATATRFIAGRTCLEWAAEEFLGHLNAGEHRRAYDLIGNYPTAVAAAVHRGIVAVGPKLVAAWAVTGPSETVADVIRTLTDAARSKDSDRFKAAMITMSMEQVVAALAVASQSLRVRSGGAIRFADPFAHFVSRLDLGAAPDADGIVMQAMAKHPSLTPGTVVSAAIEVFSHCAAYEIVTGRSITGRFDRDGDHAASAEPDLTVDMITGGLDWDDDDDPMFGDDPPPPPAARRKTPAAVAAFGVGGLLLAVAGVALQFTAPNVSALRAIAGGWAVITGMLCTAAVIVDWLDR